MRNDDDARPFSQDSVEALWSAYRRGDMVGCPLDAQNLALSIDGTTKSYRFVCTQCGIASPWFMSSPDGIVLRAVDPREMGLADGQLD